MILPRAHEEAEIKAHHFWMVFLLCFQNTLVSCLAFLACLAVVRVEFGSFSQEKRHHHQ